MCGICGLRKFGDEPIKPSYVNMLLMMNERRGNQATGIAIQNKDGKVHVLKDDEPAYKFVGSKEYKDFLAEHLSDETQIVLGHTRLATQGTPRNNANNHPVWAGKTAIVHNGMISNDGFLFNDLKIKREADVDSDIIRGILDEAGFTKKGVKMLNRVSGSAAIAAVSPEYPGMLLLARSGSPIVMASTEGDLMIWSSEKVAIHTTLRPYIRKHNGLFFQKQRPDVAFQNMSNNSVYLFNEKGLQWHDEFDGTRQYFAPIYRVNENYRSKRNQFAYEDDHDIVQCPNPECKKYILLTTPQKKVDLSTLKCGKCGGGLAKKWGSN